jgi:hypothetical protein
MIIVRRFIIDKRERVKINDLQRRRASIMQTHFRQFLRAMLNSLTIVTVRKLCVKIES